MNESDFILKWTDDLKTEIKSLTFQDDDIRKDYFDLTYDVAYCYYRGFILFKFSDFINKGQIAFNKEVYNYKIHINRVAETVKHPPLTAGYFNSLNRSLLIDAWSVFELCVTTLCNGICSKQELCKLLEFHYKEIVGEIKSTKLKDSENSAIRKLTIKRHLTHIPITRKTDFLFKKSKGYGRDIEKDKEYLRFLGRFRNTLHTNFIYYGNEFEYKIGQAHFVFKDNKIVKWYNPFSQPSKLYFYLIGELKEIWKELVMTIEHSGLIQYPDNEQK
jgi:hypothetical protein